MPTLQIALILYLSHKMESAQEGGGKGDIY